ncbi:hypothetical protein PAAG_11338 [Paracoccidioides lutzii Pb01]|uniref:Uncharacterized protein n=1 Tax=Paracoccidioides lutzii (strain ATCC MYA-826 / Pb01) TaxID=502779 RepID=A0A0A2V6G3_PARBA|nr:hypothetical protein PAAG_11338 [Paracoccidioides lutzii Pb01]KGQ01947.1 hypothetical protein PAAG_11338 [Paracoccidioides lutzii Pb01]
MPHSGRLYLNMLQAVMESESISWKNTAQTLSSDFARPSTFTSSSPDASIHLGTTPTSSTPEPPVGLHNSILKMANLDFKPHSPYYEGRYNVRYRIDK